MKTMVIVAHPDLRQSRANARLIRELEGLPDVDVRDLYREYPEFRIDTDKEQRRLLAYDRIVLQFPFFWYSCTPLLKKWFDDVFTHGWAFGPGGEHLKGKEFILATTTGGPEDGYRSGASNEFTVDELLRPIRNTIRRCNGTNLPAFVAYSVTAATDDALNQEAARYAAYIAAPAAASVH